MIPSIGIKGFKSKSTAAVDGQYQLAVTNNTYHISGNFGVTWSTVASFTAYNLVGCAVNGTGKYMIITSYNGLYTSNDLGVTWTARISNTSEFTSACISSTGQYQYATHYSNGLCRSADFGVTWTWIDPTPGMRTVSTTTDGKTVVTAVYNGYIRYNNNYGSGLFYNNTNNGKRYWNGVACLEYEASGYAHIAAAPDNYYLYKGEYYSMFPESNSNTALTSCVVAGTFNNGTFYLLISSDSASYRRNNSNGYYYIIGSSSNGSKGAAVSGKGQYQAVVSDNLLATSGDYGINWTNKGIGNIKSLSIGRILP